MVDINRDAEGGWRSVDDVHGFQFLFIKCQEIGITPTLRGSNFWNNDVDISIEKI